MTVENELETILFPHRACFCIDLILLLDLRPKDLNKFLFAADNSLVIERIPDLVDKVTKVQFKKLAPKVVKRASLAIVYRMWSEYWGFWTSPTATSPLSAQVQQFPR